MWIEALEMVRGMPVKPWGSWFLVLGEQSYSQSSFYWERSQESSNIYFIPLFTIAKLYVGCWKHWLHSKIPSTPPDCCEYLILELETQHIVTTSDHETRGNLPPKVWLRNSESNWSSHIQRCRRSNPVSFCIKVNHFNYHDSNQATKHTGKLGSTCNQEVTIQHWHSTLQSRSVEWNKYLSKVHPHFSLQQ